MLTVNIEVVFDFLAAYYIDPEKELDKILKDKKVETDNASVNSSCTQSLPIHEIVSFLHGLPRSLV